MYNIAIIHSYETLTWTTKQLLKAIERHGEKSIYITWDHILLKTGRDIDRKNYLEVRGKKLTIDAAIVRSLGRSISPEQFISRLSILQVMESNNVFVVNPSSSLLKARNKFLSLNILRANNVPIPETNLTENPSIALQLVDKSTKPLVVKPIMGSLGLGLFKVDDVDSAYHVINLLSRLKQPIILQKYIEKKNSRDIRVLVIDKEITGAMYRYAPESTWKTNIARGAKPVKAEITKDIEQVALKATESLNLFYAGIDIVEEAGTENIYVLEVNASPLWRGLQKVTQINIADILVRKIIRYLRK